MKIRKLSVLLAGLCAIFSLRLQAQPTTVERFENSQLAQPLPKPLVLNLSTNAEAPELYPGENADVGTQRILRLIPRRKYFEAAADSQYLYTDNPYLSDQNKQRTALFVNTIQVALAPDPYALGKAQFAPAVGFRSQWFNYGLDLLNDGLNRLDFNAQTAFLNGRYQLGAWQFYAGFDFTRLVEQGSYKEVYREYAPAFGIQRFFPVTDTLVFVAGVQFCYHLTSLPAQNLPSLDVNDRYDGVVNVSLNYEATRRLFVQPFYRFQYTYYPGFSDAPIPAISRNDVINTFGTSLIYYFNKYVAARVFISYEMKASSYSVAFNYHKLDAGGGLSLDFRF
jgi:hypothetical protein